MRLNSIKLLGEYKTLKGTQEHPFHLLFARPKRDYSALCFVGLNGSGKSNLIELLSDIFCYADREFNPQFQNKNDLDYDFELKYTIGNGDDQPQVKLVGDRGWLTIFRNHNNEWNLVQSSHAAFLPQQVFAYSSGHNQGLNSVYAKSQFAFYEVVRKQGVFHRDYQRILSQYQARGDTQDEAVLARVSGFLIKWQERHSKLFVDPQSYNPELDFDTGLETQRPTLPVSIFSDYSANQLTFISLYISGHDSFREFLKEEMNISRVVSFQLDFRLSEYKEVDFVFEELERLAVLARNRNLRDDYLYTGIYEFILDDQFFEDLSGQFVERTRFFEVLNFLNALSAKKWSIDEKASLKTSKYTKNVPNISGGNSPVRFVNTKVKLVNPNEETLYDRLSDGEHQLIQVMAALMMYEEKDSLVFLDEPESHFNPKWRSEFLSLIKKYVNSDNYEIVISTHSPFLISASEGRRVLHFKKDESSNITINQAEVETYGASFDSLLRSIFDLPVLISGGPMEEIKQIATNQDKQRALRELESYGESFEINYLRNKLRNET